MLVGFQIFVTDVIKIKLSINRYKIVHHCVCDRYWLEVKGCTFFRTRCSVAVFLCSGTRAEMNIAELMQESS